MKRFLPLCTAFFLTIQVSLAQTTSDQHQTVMINTAESQAFHFTGGLGVMIDAYSKALSASIKSRYPNMSVVVSMPFYMSFYDRAGLVESFTDEKRDIVVDLDYQFDANSQSMRSKRAETFHVYSKFVGERKVLFYRHMNRAGERNYFDNQVSPGERKRYAPDDLEKEAFAVYNKALAKDILLNQAEVKLVVENDWHSGMNAYYLKHHNYAHQGEVYDDSFMDRLGIDRRDFHQEGVAHGAPELGKQDHLNFLKMLLNYSDMTATVSAQHALEVLNPAFGKSLEGTNNRNALQFKKTGALNGIDYQVWNPETASEFILQAQNNEPGRSTVDFPIEEYNFNESDLSGKAKGKAFLQKFFKLPVYSDAMVLSFTSRLDVQKGYRYIPDALVTALTANPYLQVIIIGDGPDDYRLPIIELQKRFPHQLRFEKYSSLKEHLLVSYSDASGNFSEHEPSGQVHTAAMRMFTVPFATALGGHAEAIVDGVTGLLTHTYLHDDAKTVNAEMTGKRVQQLIHQAFSLYQNDRTRWNEMVLNVGGEDFSWQNQIEHHLDLIEFTLKNGPSALHAALGNAPSGVVLKPSQLLELWNAAQTGSVDHCSSILHGFVADAIK